MSLTGRQQAILDSISRQGGEVSIPNASSDVRALDSKGMIESIPGQPNVYRLTGAGRKAAN